MLTIYDDLSSGFSVQNRCEKDADETALHSLRLLHLVLGLLVHPEKLLRHVFADGLHLIAARVCE